MWSAEISRREFFEFYLGSRKTIAGRVIGTFYAADTTEMGITLVWNEDPRATFGLPSLVVAPDGEISGLLKAVNSAPQAPFPITSLSRILNHSEARQQFENRPAVVDPKLAPSLVALSIIEALLHSEGRLGVRQLTPLICKRTFSFCWARAMFAGSTPTTYSELPGRWLDVYSFLNAQDASSVARKNVATLIRPLTTLTRIAVGQAPHNLASSLAHELVRGTKETQEHVWGRMSAKLDRPIGIDALQALTREDRGAYLQQALRRLGAMSNPHGEEADEVAAACAFLATRLAPGSLEHLDALKSAATSDVQAWYGLYAALQNPIEILSLQSGLGFRLLRDFSSVEQLLSPPSADIAFEEFRVFEKIGIENLSSKLGHANELQVEIAPYVTTTFTFQARNRSRPSENQPSLDLAPSASPALSQRARLSKLAADLARLIHEMPDEPQDSPLPAKKSRRKQD